MGAHMLKWIESARHQGADKWRIWNADEASLQLTHLGAPR